MARQYRSHWRATDKDSRFLYAQGTGLTAMIGGLIVALVVGVFALDLPLYYTCQNQLQTAVNAAALAGAAYIPYGTTIAEDAVYDYAALNPVADLTLTDDNITIEEIDPATYTLKIRGEAQVPTLMAKFVCALTGQSETQVTQPPPGTPSADHAGCNWMKVVAQAKAMPAARDTMVVIDNSSSMGDMGNNRPLSYVKQAAIDYITQIQAFNNRNVDRIGLVRFAYDGTLLRPLKSLKDDPNYSQLRSAVNNISLYNAKGWNTNYEAGLKLAINELKANGRPNANQLILFFTDGLPNLPAPPTYYTYNTWQPYNRCTDMVYKDTKFLNGLCNWQTDSKGKRTRVCPSLPDNKITYTYIPNNAHQCGLDYTNYMVNTTQSLINEAEARGIVIHTITIVDPNEFDLATAVLARLRRNDSWKSGLLESMTTTTGGKAYRSRNYDAAGISQNFKDVAKDIRMKLAQ